MVLVTVPSLSQVSIQDEATPAPATPAAPTLYQEKVQAPCRPSGTCLFVHEASRERWLLLLGALQVTAGEFSFLLRAPLFGSSAGKTPSAEAGPRDRRIDEMTSKQPCRLPDSKLHVPWP